MANTITKRWWRFLALLLLGGFAGAVSGIIIKGYIETPETIPTAPPGPPELGHWGPAMEYAHALQAGDWDRAVEMTLWMQERLEQIRIETGSEEAMEAARLELITRLSDRSIADNVVLPEGIEDQYVFVPGAELEVLETDEGWEDLERPAASRLWLRVTYPSRVRAPRDSTNLPIRSMVVGINVDKDGQVLKAAIIGNLDIELDAISYAWDS